MATCEDVPGIVTPPTARSGAAPIKRFRRPAEATLRAVRVLHLLTTLDRGGAENQVAALCRAMKRRGRIEPDDMERLAGDWDVRVRRVFPLIGRVPQPLWELLRERAEVEQALQNDGAVRSIRHNYAPVCRPVRNGHGMPGNLALPEPVPA